MSEKAIFTNLCMIEDDQGRVLVQDRKNPNWPGITFPGGHVEPEESFVESCIREVKEETGLTVLDPVLCGIKQFPTEENERYVVLFFKATRFTGQLTFSEEGEVFWMAKKDLLNAPLAPDLELMLEIFENPEQSEFYYKKEKEGWLVILY